MILGADERRESGRVCQWKRCSWFLLEAWWSVKTLTALGQYTWCIIGFSVMANSASAASSNTLKEP